MFFKPAAHVDPVTVARALLTASASPGALPLNPGDLLASVRKKRGFRQLKIALPFFSFDNLRAGAAFEGTAAPSHLHVGFFGNFDKVAEPLFKALAAEGLTCYSAWDGTVLTQWPTEELPTIDRGFGERMTRILQRKTRELRETEPDEKERGRILDAFVDSPEFRAEMAREAHAEGGRRGKKAFDDVVNCYVRWKDGRASASELGAVRKLDSKLATMSFTELRAHLGGSPRLLLAVAVTPREADELRQSAERLALAFEVEPV